MIILAPLNLCRNCWSVNLNLDLRPDNGQLEFLGWEGVTSHGAEGHPSPLATSPLGCCGDSQTYFPVSTMMVNPIPVQDKLCRASIQAFIPIMPVLGSSFAQLTSSRDHAVRAIRSRWRYLQHQLVFGTGLSVAITSSRHFGTTFAYGSSSLTAS